VLRGDCALEHSAWGLTVREIQGFLADMDAIDVSPDLISTVTDAVVQEVTTCQAAYSTRSKVRFAIRAFTWSAPPPCPLVISAEA
jgi:transposase-like protein